MGHHSHTDNEKPQLAGIAIIAAAVGALTALLLAPRAGKETRREIRDRLAATKADIKTRLGEAGTAIGDEAKNVADSLNDAATLGQEQVDEAVKAAKRAARHKKVDNDDMTDHIRENGEQ